MACTPKPFTCATASRKPVRAVCVQCASQPSKQNVGSVLAAGFVAASLLVAPAQANFRLPPVDKDPNRCERAFVGNTIGQANAVSDKVLDLRSCKFSGGDFKTIVLSGALMSDADFSNANMQEVVLSKAYAVGTNFEGADFSNAVVDRTDMTKANLRGVVFRNTIVTGVVFDGADLSGANFDEALIGFEDAKRLCANPTVTGETRQSVGCRPPPKAGTVAPR